MTSGFAMRAAVLLLGAAVVAGCSGRPDSVSGASLKVLPGGPAVSAIQPGQPLIVTPSDKGGAARLAAAIGARLHAPVVSPAGITPAELDAASLIGLGSGIFDQANHASLLALADALSDKPGRRVFIFSTSGVSREAAPRAGAEDPHKALRDRLLARGCAIAGEFNCVGFNDNSFLFLVGGLNKGRPNAEDIRQAEVFADSLLPGGGA